MSHHKHQSSNITRVSTRRNSLQPNSAYIPPPTSLKWKFRPPYLELHQYSYAYERMSCFSCSPSSRCEAPLPCGHTCQSLAHDDDLEHESTHRCQVTCNTLLPCGHMCVSICHVEDKEHQAGYKCVIECEGLLICGHPCGVNSTKKKRHGCLAHKPCLGCGNNLLTTESAAKHATLTADIQNETGPVGNTDTNTKECSSLDNIMCMTPAHKCILKGAKTCWRKCKALLSCHHICCKKCHLHIPHTVRDKCDVCSKTDAVREDLHRLRIDHPKGQPFMHCEHYVNVDQCNETCNGMLCGHNCAGSKHSCSNHCRVGCKETCPVVLSCHHRCSKVCHLGDDIHQCSKFNCVNAGSSSSGELVDGPLNSKDLEECFELESQEQVESLNPGYKKKEIAKMLKTYVRPGHQCHLVKGICMRVCKTVLYCGHQCELKCYCHEGGEGPKHVTTEKCKFCSRSDATWAVFSVLNIDHPEGSPFLHCSHNEKSYVCKEFCPGRPCGQPCDVGKPNHTCSDHITSGRVECLGRCTVRFSCGHRCARRCHLGDYVHTCTKKKCSSSSGPGFVVWENIPDNDDNMELLSSMCEPVVGDQRSYVSRSFSSGAAVTDSEDSKESLEANLSVLDSEAGLTQEFEQIGKGHTCRKNQTGACQRQCDHLFECNHVCRKRCHDKTSRHRPSERCSSCAKTEDIWGELRDRGIKHPKGTPYTHCSHYKEKFACEEGCLGRLCGHRCGKNLPEPHSCSDHVPDENYNCWKRCDVGLTCGHKCSKSCHLGDGVHSCNKCRKRKTKKIEGQEVGEAKN